MATASYNVRPKAGGSRYKNGRKRSFFVRFLMFLFPCKGDGMFEAVRKLIFLGAFGCFVYFGGGVLFDIGNDLYQQNKINDQMRGLLSGNADIDPDVYNRVTAQKPQILSNYIKYYDENNDLVGHIAIPDLSSPLSLSDLGKYTVNYLVYQTYDNQYYLDYAADHTKSKGGAIFADYRNTFEDNELSTNTILYGHNISTGNYFTLVSRYYQAFEKRDMTFYLNHPVIHFNTLYEEAKWKVFAVGLYNTQKEHGDPYRYNFPEFYTKEDFNNFILDIMDRSVIFTDVDITYGDNILTLSTCYYPFTASVDTRVALFARKVRPGESAEVDTSKATFNTGYLPFDLQRQRLGNTWNGRVWDTSYLLSYEQ